MLNTQSLFIHSTISSHALVVLNSLYKVTVFTIGIVLKPKSILFKSHIRVKKWRNIRHEVSLLVLIFKENFFEFVDDASLRVCEMLLKISTRWLQLDENSFYHRVESSCFIADFEESYILRFGKYFDVKLKYFLFFKISFYLEKFLENFLSIHLFYFTFSVLFIFCL